MVSLEKCGFDLGEFPEEPVLTYRAAYYPGVASSLYLPVTRFFISWVHLLRPENLIVLRWLVVGLELYLLISSILHALDCLEECSF